jgi:hypothetical protein
MTGREARATIPIEGALQTVALDPQLQVLMESTFVRK